MTETNLGDVELERENERSSITTEYTETFGFCSKVKSLFTIDMYMLPCKLTYFFSLGKDAAFQPFILPFMRGVGLSTREAGLISGLRLIGMILGGPFWGYIADKNKNHKRIVLLLIVCSLILIGGQPFLSTVVGDKEQNVCPASNSVKYSNGSLSNSTKTHSTDEFVSTAFFAMLCMNIAGSFFDGTIMSMIDTGVIQRIHAADKKKDFGWNRLFGAIGYSFGSFLSGITSNYFPESNINCFSAIYCCYTLLLIAAAISSQFLFLGKRFKKHEHQNECEESNTSKIGKAILQTMLNIEVILFFQTVFFMGFFFGIYVNFISLRLQELEAQTFLIGLTLSLGALFCLPVFIFASKFIKVFGGLWNTITICCFSYVIRFFAFAFIKNPWLAIPINVLNTLGFGLNIVALVLYVKRISTPQIYTTMLSIMNVTFYGIAFITASIGGGYFFNRYQGAVLFGACGGVAAVWTFVLVFLGIVKHLKAKRTTKTPDDNSNAMPLMDK